MANVNAQILERLIEEDFGIDHKGDSRWGKADEHSSLVLDYERGLFFWNSKDIVGDALVYLTKVRGMSFGEAREHLSKLKNFSDTYVYTIKGEDADIIVYPRLVDVFHSMGRDQEARKYLYDRGINDDTIDRFQVGYYNGYTTIPIFMDGSFRNFQMRKDSPKRIKKYYKGTGALLYNSDLLKIVDRVFITEGLTDCLVLNQYGVPAVSSDSGASGWLTEWFKYFIRCKEIYVCYDNDVAGQKGAVKVAKALGEYRTKIYTFKGYEDKYDITNYFQDGGTREDFLQLIDKESRYVFEI